MILLWIIGAIILLFGVTAFFGAPYVPSKRSMLEEALTTLYPLGSGDVLLDVGSGDGVVLRMAARHGAKAIGYEINPLLVLISRILSRGQKGVLVRLTNFWVTPLPNDTTVVYMFSVSRDQKRMVRKLEKEASRLRRNLAVITFGVPLPARQPVKQVGAYFLYQIHPLQ